MATLSVKSTDGRTATIPVYLFPSTWAVRAAPQGGSDGDLSTAVPVSAPVSASPLTMLLRPFLVEPATGLPFWSQAPSVRGASDPFFLRTESSNPEVVVPPAAGVLINEGDSGASFQVQLKSAGSAVVNVVQPDGFVAVPASSLAVNVFTPSLAFGRPPLLSTDFQLPVNVYGVGASLGSSTPVKVTSLDPSKLLLSRDGKQTGQASLTGTVQDSLYLQALSAAQTGDTVQVRLEAASFTTSEVGVLMVPAELQSVYTPPITLDNSYSNSLSLRAGPASEPGRLWDGFYGGVRPGVSMKIRLSSSDPSIVSVPVPEVELKSTMNVQLTAGKPGQARILVEAPPQIVNRVASVDVTVNKYRFTSNAEWAARYLRTRLTLVNPRSQTVVATLTNAGILPLLYAESAVGAASESLTLSLAGNETRTLYVEPGGQSGYASYHVDAEDFQTYESGVSVMNPRILYGVTSPVVLAASGGSASIPVMLAGAYGGTAESPLGSSYGPLDVQVQSSNPQVVRVTSPTVRFMPGESRRSISIEPAGKGDAIISLILPAGFSGSDSPRVDLLVTVK